jgi:N-carbamoyl-L-amino-acid hydrolase
MSTGQSLPHNDLRVDPARLQTNFDALSRIGSTPDGGVNRPAFSESHISARAWFKEQILHAGLEFLEDGAGNHSAFLPCGPPGAAVLLVGSHLDSVPKGGRYDGTLGVLAALELLRVVKENRLRLPVHLEAIDFTDEEGAYIGLLGSRALAGSLTQEQLDNPRGGRENLEQGFDRSGLSDRSVLSARRDAHSIAGYLELHIEQGSRLEQANADIGSVSAINGISSYQITFNGRADHAGTTPMGARLDAAKGASAFTLAVHEIVSNDFRDCVANIGNMQFSPGAFNIVPEQVSVSLEFRAPDSGWMNALQQVLLDCARSESSRHGLDLNISPHGKHDPAMMSEPVQHCIRQACELLNLRCIPLISGAGHDAQSLAQVCHAGMIFVPSTGGFSHSAREYTDWGDCLNGANTLLQAALNFASRLQDGLSSRFPG